MFQQLKHRSTQAMFLTKFRRPLVISVMSLMLVACSVDESAPASSLRTGVFLDAAVEGLGYVTETMSGKTNAAGEFNFNAGELITFSIGGLNLPTVQAADIVTPLDMFATDNTEDVQVANLSRLLQSMDADADTSNGISLPLTVESITSDAIINFADDNFDAQALSILAQVNESQVHLVDAATATAHFNQTLVDNGLAVDDCTSDHPLVGSTAELSTLQHGVSGAVTVLNDCVLEVTNFNFDGGGPEVFFLVGTDRTYYDETLKIGSQLNGQQWVNDTVRLPIPENLTLDDFDSLSVWCFRFGINFGDASFVAN